MAGHHYSRAQRLAWHLIRLACMRLSGEMREDRYREWTAELHAILHDPDIPSRARRNARALLYAADQNRGARRLARASREPALPARARGSSWLKTPVGRQVFVTVMTLVLLAGEWINEPHWSHFLPTAGPLILGIYPVAMFRIRRSSRPHLMRSPDDDKR
jgi:hypothetical protein